MKQILRIGNRHEVSDEFWRRTKAFITSLALVQQATELLLKEKLLKLAVLLISGDPRIGQRL